MAANHIPMRTARALVASNPLQFGRGRAWRLPGAEEEAGAPIPGDLKLFATTFAAGFLFVSILIA
jgi:hypothetical protein